MAQAVQAQTETQDNFWEQFEVAEYDKPQYDEAYWGQFEEEPQNKRALETSLKELPSDDAYVKTQEYQTEQLANMLFTKEELEDIKNSGEIGWVEYRQRGFVGWSDVMPVVGTAKQAYNAGKALAIAKKMENGEEINDADKTYMRDYLRNYTELQLRGMKWSARGASMFIQAPAFMVEFALSGGIGEIAAKGGIKASAKVASKLAVKSATKTAAKAASKATGEVALEGVAKGAARAAGQHAVLVPMYAVANYNERKIADGLNITDKGDMIFDSEAAEASNKENAAKAFGTAEIQILSEMTGGIIGRGAKGALGLGAKAIGKVKTTNTARGISAATASVYNQLPKNVRVKLEASARVAQDLGKKTAQAGEKAKEAGKAAGFHGTLEEYGEERVEDILMTAFDLDREEGYTKQQFVDAIFPGFEQSLLELGIFTIVGATSFSTRTVINDFVKRGYSEKEATTIAQNLSEIEKENLTDDILGEVNINEDIKESEVIKEEIKINNALTLKGSVEMNVPAETSEQTQEKVKNLSEYRNAIVKNKFEKTPLETYKNAISGKVYSKTPQTMTNEIVQAERAFNNVINEIYKNPSIVNDENELSRLERTIDEITWRLPEEESIIKPYYEKYYNAINNAAEYLDAKNKKQTKVAAEMYDVSNTASAMTSYEEQNKPQKAEKKTIKPPAAIKEVEEIATKEAEKIEEKRGFKELFNDFKDVVSEKIEPFYKEAVDRFAPIQNVVKRANKKGAELGIDITDNNWTENPYNLARMYSGLANRIWQHFTENTMKRSADGTQEITGEGFGKIINDLYEQTKDIESNKETQLKDFEDYLIAKRYLLDLKDRDGYEATDEQKLKAIQDMARITEKYGEDIIKLEKLADRVYEYNRRTLHLLVDSGNMSQEVYDNIIEKNPHHISYKRIMDENYGMNGLSFAKGKFTDAKSPVKKIKGSEREIQSIYKSTLEDTMRIIDVAERNRIAAKIAALQEYLPEEVKPIKPLMRKTKAKVKVAYDAKMRNQLLQAIEYFGGKFENAKSIKTPTGYAWGSYGEEEKLIRKKLGSQDRTLAHEVGHMLDDVLGIEDKIKKNPAIMKEIKTLAEDRFNSVVKLEEGEWVTEEAENSEKYKNYAKSNKEAIANAFDLYFTSRDYVKRVAPETAKFIDNLFKGKYAFLNEIRPSSEIATEEIEQDVWSRSPEKPSKNAIGYYEDGKLKFVEVAPNVMEAVEDLNPKEMGIIKQVADKVGRLSSNVLRAGATLNPEFILRNPIRDIQEAWYNVDGFNPIIDMPKGLLAVIGKNNSELYKEWQREGGSFNSYMELNEKTIKEAVDLYEQKRPLIWKALGFVPEQLEKLSSTLEESTRLGIYNAMKRKGLSSTQAAFMSREGTLDFARGGRAAKFINRYVPFFNAGIQGTDRVLRTLISNPKLAAQKALIMAAAQAAITGYYLYLAPDDDREEYLEIPEWQKNIAYVFKVGDRWWKIPRPFAPGYLFEAIPEKFMIWAYTKKKPEGLELFNFAKDLFTTASPITDPSDFIPPPLKVWIETQSNWNFFTKRHIYPEYLNQYEPKERYTKSTTETAKLLGEKLNMSPALIENAIRGQFGGAGMHVVNLGDVLIDVVKKASGETINERPYDINRYPVVKGFAVKEPIGNNSQSLNTFYDKTNKLAEINSTYKKLDKENKKEARAYREQHQEELSEYKFVENDIKQIKKLRTQANKIYKNSALDGKEKAEQINKIERQMTQIAKKANKKMES